MEKRICQFVKKVRHRLMIQEMLRSLQVTLLVGMGIALLISVASLLVPIYYAPHAQLAVMAAALLAGMIWGILRTPDMEHAALAADAKGNQERLVTALSYMTAGQDNPYQELLMKDASESVRGFQSRKQVPIRLSVRLLVFFLAVTALFTVSCLTDSVVRHKTQAAHAARVQAGDTIDEIEKVEKALEESDALSASELEEYLEQLELSKTELAEADTAEELLKAQERLTQKLENVSSQISEETLAKTVSEAASQTQTLAGKTRESLIEEAQEALAAAEDGSTEEKEYAVEKLSELASALGDDALQEAADQYQSSNYSGQNYAAAKSALNQAINDLGNRTMLADNSTGNASEAGNTSSEASVSTGTGSGSSSEGSSGSEGSSSEGRSGSEGSRGSEGRSLSEGRGN